MSDRAHTFEGLVFCLAEILSVFPSYGVESGLVSGFRDPMIIAFSCRVVR